MRKTFGILAIVVLLARVAAQVPQADTGLSPFGLAVFPALSYPLGPNSELFAPGGRGGLALEYALPGIPEVAFQGGVGYAYDSYKVSGSGSLSQISAELGAGLGLPLVGPLGLRFFARGGMSWGFENATGADKGIASGVAFSSLESGLGLSWALSPALALRLDASYRYDLGLLGSAGLGLGLAWRLPRAQAASGIGPRLLQFSDLKIGNVYPVFHAWYDENPVGSVTVKNVGTSPASGINFGFLVKQYMDAPKACANIELLKPGESRAVPLFALFNSSILDVTEATKATAEVTAEYRVGTEPASQSATASVAVYDRNAMTWDDDRKAAAFVSGKDPWVLVLSNQVTSIVKPLRNPGIDKTLQIALAFHEALRVYGLSYVTNPKTPFASIKANPEIVDFLKFPRQTLSYKAGDCSDLSILYASMFESVGVETAFITVPGHILMAVAIDTPPNQVSSKLSSWNDLVVRDGKAWLPIETTMRDGDFFAAWREAAREWR
ncbi:MAG: hypothetical protein WCL50_05980 [Spirochaetota bacterium]